VTKCSVVVGYQHFGGLRRLRLNPEHGGVTWYPILTLQGVTTQKTSSSILVTKFNVVISVSVMSIHIHLMQNHIYRTPTRTDHRLGKNLLCSEPVTYLITCV
jgi:hypothetical protein